MKALSDAALLRVSLREDLFPFTVRAFQTVNPGTPYHHNWHIEAIIHQLMCTVRGSTHRLLINQPPRSLKSLCVSVAYVAWRLGHNPSLRFICVSYAAELAGELARQFRQVIESDWYRAIFPGVRIAKDTALEIVTTKGGGRFATSVGGTLTGRGAEIIIVDDPLKSEDAQSKPSRDKVLSWYKGTLVSRLNDKAQGVLIVVMQRLHMEDLSGFLLEQGGWQHLCLPAIAPEPQGFFIHPQFMYNRKAGEVLHSQLEPIEVLEQIKAEIGSLHFSAQYLQCPIAAEGNLIRWAWFKRYAQCPDLTAGHIVQSWDTAQKITENTDYSVCTTWLVKDGLFYLLDVFRARLEYPQLKRAVVAQAHTYSAHRILIEDKVAGTSLIQELQYEYPRLDIIGVKPEGDKLTRMATEGAAIEVGKVVLPERAAWLDTFQQELLAFPRGRYDDQVDSLSQFLRWQQAEARMPRGRCGRVVGCY